MINFTLEKKAEQRKYQIFSNFLNILIESSRVKRKETNLNSKKGTIIKFIHPQFLTLPHTSFW